MKKMKCSIVLLSGFLSTMVSASDSYLCVANLATGFSFDEKSKQWQVANFHPTKYVLSKSKVSGRAWEVKEMGEKSPVVSCDVDFNKLGVLFCDVDPGIIFRMSKINLRFIAIHIDGYWNDYIKPINGFDSTSDRMFLNKFYKEGTTTPGVEIGECSPL